MPNINDSSPPLKKAPHQPCQGRVVRIGCQEKCLLQEHQRTDVGGKPWKSGSGPINNYLGRATVGRQRSMVGPSPRRSIHLQGRSSHPTHRQSPAVGGRAKPLMNDDGLHSSAKGQRQKVPRFFSTGIRLLHTGTQCIQRKEGQNKQV